MMGLPSGVLIDVLIFDIFLCKFWFYLMIIKISVSALGCSRFKYVLPNTSVLFYEA